MKLYRTEFGMMTEEAYLAKKGKNRRKHRHLQGTTLENLAEMTRRAVNSLIDPSKVFSKRDLEIRGAPIGIPIHTEPIANQEYPITVERVKPKPQVQTYSQKPRKIKLDD